MRDKTKFREYKNKKKQEFREFIQRLKNVPCMDCGQRFPHYIMEFDHCRGDKYKNIWHFQGHGITSPMFLKELSKCDIVCANCHAARTYFRGLISL